MARLNLKKYLTVLAVIIVLISLHYSKLLKPVESFLGSKLNPVLQVFFSFSSSISQVYFKQTATAGMAEELKSAKEIINRLTAEKVEAKFLQEENLALRKQLNFFAKSGRRYIVANIISRGEPASDASRSVLIDKGSKDGLFSGLAAVTIMGSATSSQGVIIGKIVNVQENFSEIYLVTDKNCKLAAAILGEQKTAGIASGELGLTIKMDFIPQTENIRAGDLVATSGLEQNIPRGLLVGRVVKVVKENNEVWQTASIEPQTNLDYLSVISILLP